MFWKKKKVIKGKFTVYQPVLTEQMTSTEKCDFWDTCKGLMLLTGRCQGTAALGNDPTEREGSVEASKGQFLEYINTNIL